jgi:hypothetical protein
MPFGRIRRREAMKKNPKEKSKKDIAASYNQFKLYHGHQYTGMTVGRSHKWYYDKGIWIDKKITPEKWLISYNAVKKRAGKAPEGSGVPVGTEYHWYILAHQMVKKLDANSYSTSMNGLKYKLAHKRKDKDKWNISDRTQRTHLVKILKEFINEIEEEPIEEFVAGEKNPVKTKKTIKKKTTVKKKVAEPELA